MKYRIKLSHNFETAHRLADPDSPVKCQSIHGHSWWVTATVEADGLNNKGMVVEFGAFKKAWRSFLDGRLDHHLVCRAEDPVAAAIREVMPDARILEVPFDPTTENLAEWILFESNLLLRAEVEGGERARVSKIHLQETRVNAAEVEA